MTAGPATTAADLVSAYQQGSMLFSAPGGGLLAEGVYFAVPPSARDSEQADLADRVAASLGVAEAAGHGTRIVVGAVPFAPDVPARLVVPQRVRRTAPLPTGGPPAPGAVSARCTVRPDPAPERYRDAVAAAVRGMRAGEYAKVVLARSLVLTPAEPIDLPGLLARLAARDPRGYTYAADLGGGRTLFGASPELLVSRTGRRVVANPMAGSAARSTDPGEDARRAAALLASAKDRREHAVVADAVADTLRPLCTHLAVPEPELAATATMWHLSTRITGDLADPAPSALELATRLHPTPAVCGSPAGPARAAIAELEGIDRGFYAGVVGWGDAGGDGEWVVAIRCGVAEGDTLRLYAGAGIVAGSEPAAELAETSAKFATMLDALGLADVAR